jgi:hypothetical protein
LPERVSRALIDIGGQWPEVFGGAVAYSQADGVRVEAAGIFDGSRKVADLAQVVQRAPRGRLGVPPHEYVTCLFDNYTRHHEQYDLHSRGRRPRVTNPKDHEDDTATISI